MDTKNEKAQSQIKDILSALLQGEQNEDQSDFSCNEFDEEGANSFQKERRAERKQDRKQGPIVSDDVSRKLFEKRGMQNLKERLKLLDILKIFFVVQLISMNLIVFILVLWVVFDLECFNTIDKELFESISTFMKFYISVVLVELLGGIIYIVHKVFSEKFADTFPK